MSLATDPISCLSTQSTVCGMARLRTQRVDPLLGRRVGGTYQLCERVGRGAYGTVYRARHLLSGHSVAVKVLRPLAANESAFLGEAGGASRVHHPNVVTFLDMGEEEDGLLYLVMEYIDGPTLSRLILASPTMPVARALRLMLQVCFGLEAVHLSGIVHADLKSSNILVYEQGGEERVKLVDFGIARCVDPQRLPPSELDEIGPDAAPYRGDSMNISGTPGYIAPEVLQGSAPTYRADVYAAGVVLYRLLTGRRPFTGSSAEVIHEKQLTSDPVPPSQLRAHSPAALEALTLRALARDPAERFADALEMREALESVAVALVDGISPRPEHADQLRGVLVCGGGYA